MQQDTDSFPPFLSEPSSVFTVSYITMSEKMADLFLISLSRINITAVFDVAQRRSLLARVVECIDFCIKTREMYQCSYALRETLYSAITSLIKSFSKQDIDTDVAADLTTLLWDSLEQDPFVTPVTPEVPEVLKAERTSTLAITLLGNILCKCLGGKDPDIAFWYLH